MFVEVILLFFAGLLGGMLNSIAGGGTFIIFPALLFVGIPPISANATTTFASCSGYISGVYALKKDLIEHKSELPKYIVISLLGGITGGWLLLQTPERIFQETIPWLLLIATLLFIFGARLNDSLKRLTARHQHASLIGSAVLLVTFICICIYGGFFNAGFGIIMLSYLVLSGHTDINAMNGLKLLSATCVSLSAIGLFAYKGEIAWLEGTAVFAGTFVGGYLAARVSRRIPQAYVRNFVSFAGIVITLYFFYDVYSL